MIIPWAVNAKKGRLFSYTRVQYVAQFFSPFALQYVKKSLELKK